MFAVYVDGQRLFSFCPPEGMTALDFVRRMVFNPFDSVVVHDIFQGQSYAYLRKEKGLDGQMGAFAPIAPVM